MENITEKTDIEIIELIRQGEKEIYAELVRRHEALIAATIYGIIGDHPEAEDIGINFIT